MGRTGPPKAVMMSHDNVRDTTIILVIIIVVVVAIIILIIFIIMIVIFVIIILFMLIEHLDHNRLRLIHHNLDSYDHDRSYGRREYSANTTVSANLVAPTSASIPSANPWGSSWIY